MELKKNIDSLLGDGSVSIMKDIVDVEGTDVDSALSASASRLANSISDRSECDLNFIFHSILNEILPIIHSAATML